MSFFGHDDACASRDPPASFRPAATDANAIPSKPPIDDQPNQNQTKPKTPNPKPQTPNPKPKRSCATAVNLAFDGTDAKSRAFTTAAAVRNLNSYSLLRLYSAGKDRFFAAADAWSGPVGDAWGKFRDAQGQLAAAYTEGDSGRVTGGGSTIG